MFRLADGILYLNSGYGGQGMAGNILLAFSVNAEKPSGP
jgi:hypothetical protein